MMHMERASHEFEKAANVRATLIAPNMDVKRYSKVADSLSESLTKSFAYKAYDLVNTLSNKYRLAEDDSVKALIKRWKNMQKDGTMEQLKQLLASDDDQS